MPAIPDLDQPLRDGRVALRFGSERDIPEILIAHQDDPQLHERLREPRPPSGAELGRRAEQAPAERAAGARATLTILEGGSDVCRGQIDVCQLDWDHQRAELEIWVVPQCRRTGLGHRGLALTGRWLLQECGLQRVQIVTDPDNEAMIRAGRAAGFLDEGILRAYQRGERGRVDVAVLSLLPADLQS
jgi:[ribosomal protein S5]-alanine N-acetyltransferase